ncbi:MAG: hypothetical protein IIA33_10600, partial [Planctomycetes bacterium]|nr:hypothetical protein [Planctomycetota bacterium]
MANSGTNPSYHNRRPTAQSERQTDAELLSVVYDELRNLAHHKMAGERIDHTLQATALVHEVYLRLVEGQAADWKNRAHFFAAAAHAMRRILVERARKYGRQKHGAGRKRVDLDDVGPAGPEASGDDLIALDEALRKLEAQDRVRGDVVKLRYFAGLTIDQAADVPGISPAKVSGHWT